MKSMKIKLTCKLNDADARYFIDPIISSNGVGELTLYRNNNPHSKNHKWESKVTGVYHTGWSKLIFRFIRMVTDKPVSDMYIGIYEIPHGLLALFAAKICNKPVVVSVIGNPKYDIRNKGFRGYITKYIYKWADVITITGSQSKRYIENTKNIISEKIFILPNSVPINEFINGSSKKSNNKRYDLVTLGRLSSEKGLLNLLDIINIIRKKIPKIKLGIAGQGPQMKELQSRIIELKLEQNVSLLGYVQNARDFLASGKLFITTSFTEGLPRTAIQSMIGGVPVVASNVGDISDLVINERTGILIDDPNNLTAFAEGILETLSDTKLYSKYSLNAVNHCKQYYSHEAATKVWNDIIEYLHNLKRRNL
jgi:glycosyltransferase involved in cell wall biosynthesis